MSDEAFRELVKDMRDAQQTYFRQRTQDALRRSKALEAKVDEELSGQMKLFTEE